VPTALAYEEILRRLVAFDTTSPESNLPAVDWLAERLDRPGVAIERNLSSDGRKANLCVRLGPPGDVSGREGLVLCGHLDTVPAGEPGWTSDPFSLTDRGERWVARGVCDMKGFVAVAAAHAEGIHPGSLEAPLALLFTYDEEVGSLGAQRFVATSADRPPLPSRVVVGEPTSLEVVRLHRGHLRMSLEVDGESAHGGTPHLGSNAVTAAARAVVALDRLAGELAAERPPHAGEFPQAPYVALNVGRIDGGRAVNVVPDRCSVLFGLRPLPGMDSQALVERARGAVAEALGETPWRLRLDNESPPFLGSDSGLAAEILDLVSRTETHSAPFSSDAGTLQRLGHECVLWGPGSIAVAHRPNEWIAKAELERAHELLGRLIAARCGGSNA
jgi:acetylornithine deacetylase